MEPALSQISQRPQLKSSSQTFFPLKRDGDKEEKFEELTKPTMQKKLPREGQESKDIVKGHEIKLGKNFDSFLKLLLTQLKHQNPTDPMSAQDFTTQLVQFAGVEQDIFANKQLGELVTLQKKESTMGNMLLVNRQAKVISEEVKLEGRPVEIFVERPEEAKHVSISLIGEDGAVKRTLEVGGVGAQGVVWDGLGDDKNSLPEGTYKIMAVAHYDENKKIPLKSMTMVTIEGVDYEGETPALIVGNMRIDPENVQQIYAKNRQRGMSLTSQKNSSIRNMNSAQSSANIQKEGK